jgi:hypothetical protein
MLVSGGKTAPEVVWQGDGEAGGSVTVRSLHSAQVLFQYEGLHAGDTKCMWTGSNLLAWAGLEFATVLDVRTGNVLVDFVVKNAIVMGVHCFLLDDAAWVLVLAFQSRLLALSIADGTVCLCVCVCVCVYIYM